MSQRRQRRRRIVGVMIDGDVLRGVELKRGLRGLRFKGVAEVVVPDGTREQGRIIDQSAMADAFKALWKEGGFRAKRVAFGISGRDVTIRPMSVPTAASTDVGGFARYELGEYLPYDLDHSVVDHRIMGDADTNGDGHNDTVTEVIAVGVRTSLVEEVAAAVAEAGLVISSIDAAPTALAAAIAPMASEQGTEALVSVDGTRTTVVLRAGGRPRVVRVLAEGGGDRSTQLAEELESLIATVDQHRRGGEQQWSVDGQSRRFTEAAEAVTAAIRYDIGEQAGSGVSRVVLTGAFGEYELLHQFMAEASGVEVIGAPTPPWWGNDDDFDHYVEPAGLAYAALGNPAERFDLMAPTVVESRQRRRERVAGLVLGIALVAGGIPLVDQVWSETHRLNAQAAELERNAGELRTQTEALAPAGEMDDALEVQRIAIDNALEDDLWWARIMEEIADAMPMETFLTSMSLVRPVGTDNREDFVATFTGVGHDQAAVGAWLAAMSDLDVLDDVWLVQATASVYGTEGTPVVAFLAEARLTTDAKTLRALEGADLLLASGSDQEPAVSP